MELHQCQIGAFKYLVAEPEAPRVALGVSKDMGGFKAEVSLFYPSTDVAGMLAIARESERQGHVPEVNIWEDNLLVEFVVRPVSVSFLQKFGDLPEELFSTIPINTVLNALTAAAGMESRGVDLFTKLFAVNKSFMLCMRDIEDGRTVLWCTRLFSFETCSPDISSAAIY
jgi:hypothetical protein